MKPKLSQLYRLLLAPVALTAALALQPAATSWAQQVGPDGWTTPLAEELGVSLFGEFDSSGEDAWDPVAHPNVFITTEGPGYGGLLSGVTLPGIAIIDSDTRGVVASQNYDVLALGWQNVFEPHGLGVSPDGQWIYLPAGEGSFGTRGKGHLLIINARTLKIDKILNVQSNVHHAKSYINGAGEGLVLVESFSGGFQPTFVLDPANNNVVVGGVDKAQLNNHGSGLGFITPDGSELFIAVGNTHSPSDAIFTQLSAAVYRIDTATWERKAVIEIPDGNPIWTSFSADNRYAYITGSHGSRVFKYDREREDLISWARAGVEGPYGVHLGWGDEFAYTVGKGESSHNRGRVLGIVNTELMDRPHGTSPTGQVSTGCIRGDHATLHPDPDANELWITCNSSFEIVVFDLDQNEVSARIPMPNGGSTHSGAFVQYNGWDGEVVADQNGLQGSALALKQDLLEQAAFERNRGTTN